MAAIKFVSHFVPDQLCRTPSPPTRSFVGETVIVTGSNTGLGKDAARQMTILGAAKVILAVRSLSKGEEAKKDIESSTGKHGVLDVWQLDLSSYQSVINFSNRCEKLPRLDAVLMNAGISTEEYRRAENNELTITVNLISTFLLSLLLLPKLRRDSREHNFLPRLSIVASDLFEVAPLKAKAEDNILKAMNDEKVADMKNRYPDSKLLEVLYFQRLIKELKPNKSNEGVIINILNPGFCASDLLREGDFGAASKMVQNIIARSTEEGARCLVYSAGAGAESHGHYMSNGVIRDITRTWAGGKQGVLAAARVFAEVNEQLESIVPNVTQNI